MAGDWIKLENATPEKPEMIILGRLLGVPRSLSEYANLSQFIIERKNCFLACD
jgi:hypothetical protein